ncbi:lipopolysaccharide biosynthesis protein [Metabacillus litoralis]|uniref:lipopolysaccharide biosynthesis protein n=1 Tax=Metabacillus litoralis TaxID=152268 RepID=UPI001CFD5CD3|nr:oligosaccharide flippase family protein [Metabacillus litoralis]
MNENLLQKFLKFSYGNWVGLIIGLFTTMVITRLLSPTILGKASMFEIFIQVGFIITVVGADQAFLRFFYEEQPNKRGVLLYNSLRIPVLTSFTVIVLIILFYKPITAFLFEKESFILALALAFGIVAQLFLRFSELVIRMQQKGNLYSLLQIFQKLFYLSLILIFFYLIGPNFEVLVFSKVATFILTVGIAIYYGKSLWKLSNFKIKGAKHTQKDILKYGLPFVLTIFLSWLFEAFDKIAIRQWSTYEELGLYSAAMRLVILVMVFRHTFSTFWTPVAYEKFEKRPDDKDFFRYISIVVSFLMFLVAIFSIAAKDIIVILLGSDYRDSASIVPFLVFMPILYTISETTVIGINFYKKINWHIFIAGIACGVNILGNSLIVPHFGAIGASIVTAFSFVVFFTLRTLISLKYYKVKYPLIRIYLMVIIISIYALISIEITNFMHNILLALIPLLILNVLFLKDLWYFVKNRKILLN